jgi:hypothetical protein
MSQQGFLVCADITGYTHYLDESELDHASRILSDVLDLLLGEVQTPLRLSRVEGDAVISYAPAADAVNPQVLVDRLENTYVAFRRALDQIVANSACGCRACANLSWLDLKFIVHHGEFVVQRIGVQDELVGPAVNLLFRLTKNTIREALGMAGYLAFTEDAVTALALPGYVAELVEHLEPAPSGDPKRLLVKDMAPTWEERRVRGTLDLADEDLLVTLEREFPARLTVVWDYLTSPALRALMFGSDRDDVQTLEDGRMGVDAVYVCWHGKERLQHRIVDWDPPVRYAFLGPVGDATALGEFTSRAHIDGTIVNFRSTVPRTPDGAIIPEELHAVVAAELIEYFDGAFDRILERLESDLAAAS